MGTIKGVGRIYQQTFVDTYSKVAVAKLYTGKTPLTAADLLNDRGHGAIRGQRSALATRTHRPRHRPTKARCAAVEHQCRPSISHPGAYSDPGDYDGRLHAPLRWICLSVAARSPDYDLKSLGVSSYTQPCGVAFKMLGQ